MSKQKGIAYLTQWKYTKHFLSLVLALSLMFTLNACAGISPQSSIIIPDVRDSEETVAKNIISSLGLFPEVQYCYDDTVAEGKVIQTTPDVGDTVTKGDTVVLSISKGPKIVKPKNGKFSFDDVYEDSSDYQKASIRKEEGVLYIDCDVTFLSVGHKYKVPEEGLASTDANFMFSIPIKITNISQSDYEYIASRNKFTVEIPLDKLGDSAPTRIYLNLDSTYLDPSVATIPVTRRIRAWFALEW